MSKISRLVGGFAAVTILGSSANLASAQPSPPPPPQNIADAASALAAAPKVDISNGLLKATVLTPNAKTGFYRATRFDWSGMIADLTYKGQAYYGLWFDQTASNVRDFVLHDAKLVAGPNTAALGPAEAFDPVSPPGFDAAAAGEPFLKLGVGLLRKPDGQAYNQFRLYEIVDGGRWTTRAARDRVTSTQTLADTGGGWGYVYSKTVRLIPGKPQLVIEHSLKNTGVKAIQTSTFNHNFLTLGQRGVTQSVTAADLTLTTAFALSANPPPRSDAIRIDGKTLAFNRALADGQTAQATLSGFGETARDHEFSLINRAGVGYSVTGDQPLTSLVFWSIRRTASAEPYVALTAAPGQTVTWRSTYTYFAP